MFSPGAGQLLGKGWGLGGLVYHVVEVLHLLLWIGTLAEASGSIPREGFIVEAIQNPWKKETERKEKPLK